MRTQLNNLKQIGDIIINTDIILSKGFNYTSYKAVLKNSPNHFLEAYVFSYKNNESTEFLINKHLRIVKNLRHKNVLTYHSAVKTENHIYVFYEYCKTRLSAILKESASQSPLNESEIIRIFKDLCQAYKDVCYSNNIVHRNLKPKYILFDKNGVLKLSNFNIAAQMSELSSQRRLHTKAGSNGYIAPEVCQEDGYNNRCDIWSLGVILFEMLFSQLPFNLDGSTASFDSLKFPSQREISVELKSLITKMLRQNPEERISWEDLFANPLINLQKTTTNQK